MVASTWKWTTPYTCLGFNDSESKLYNNLEFCEENDHKHLKYIVIYKAKQFVMKKSFKTSLHILEDNASGVQVSNIELVSLNFFIIW